MSGLKTLVVVAACACLWAPARAQLLLDSSWTYQGKIDVAGTPLDGSADLVFGLWDAGSAGNQIGASITLVNVSVNDGLFSVPLDFGADAFNGEQRWLEIAVRSPSGGGVYTTLAPRQAITGTPYALQTRGMFVDDSNRVGIGTDAPSVKLEVDSGNVWPTQQLDSSSTAGTWLRLNNSDTGGANWSLISSASGNGEGPGRLLFHNGNTRMMLSSTRLAFRLDDMSILFPSTDGINNPMIYMFDGGAGNGDRMVLAHSPTFPTWGMQYRDSVDAFDFLRAGISLLTVSLGTNAVGIREANPQDALDIGTGAIRFPDETRQTTAYAPLVTNVPYGSFSLPGNGQAEFGQTVNGALPGMAVIVTPTYRLWPSDVIAYAYVEANDYVVWRLKNNDGVTRTYGAAVWRITVLP